ncbi:hypothetical protein SCHPADRAFT_897222 [Schizopora paradoxa]|uniref:Uncharacterized protein n=1 Tax=Schizopora paradoxa TaxID=27342 RepID=A0A0H2QX60_9AGAM|nr:hypothetical protein SCHPADRAFT_897222 [Schizopora paradoxa]
MSRSESHSRSISRSIADTPEWRALWNEFEDFNVDNRKCLSELPIAWAERQERAWPSTLALVETRADIHRYITKDSRKSNHVLEEKMPMFIQAILIASKPQDRYKKVVFLQPGRIEQRKSAFYTRGLDEDDDAIHLNFVDDLQAHGTAVLDGRMAELDGLKRTTSPFRVVKLSVSPFQDDQDVIHEDLMAGSMKGNVGDARWAKEVLQSAKEVRRKAKRRVQLSMDSRALSIDDNCWRCFYPQSPFTRPFTRPLHSWLLPFCISINEFSSKKIYRGDIRLPKCFYLLEPSPSLCECDVVVVSYPTFLFEAARRPAGLRVFYVRVYSRP